MLEIGEDSGHTVRLNIFNSPAFDVETVQIAEKTAKVANNRPMTEFSPLKDVRSAFESQFPALVHAELRPSGQHSMRIAYTKGLPNDRFRFPKPFQ